ncbi:hypothetical protein DENSPDRAFT_831723 [Dentipellis sp. KUC8613]|nr:hypothetical protein DENSPDRAFT_831723 [Dentipellis sp. KUC8613]
MTVYRPRDPAVIFGGNPRPASPARVSQDVGASGDTLYGDLEADRSWAPAAPPLPSPTPSTKTYTVYEDGDGHPTKTIFTVFGGDAALGADFDVDVTFEAERLGGGDLELSPLSAEVKFLALEPTSEKARSILAAWESMVLDHLDPENFLDEFESLDSACEDASSSASAICSVEAPGPGFVVVIVTYSLPDSTTGRNPAAPAKSGSQVDPLDLTTSNGHSGMSSRLWMTSRRRGNVAFNERYGMLGAMVLLSLGVTCAWMLWTTLVRPSWRSDGLFRTADQL